MTQEPTYQNSKKKLQDKIRLFERDIEMLDNSSFDKLIIEANKGRKTQKLSEYMCRWINMHIKKSGAINEMKAKLKDLQKEFDEL